MGDKWLLLVFLAIILFVTGVIFFSRNNISNTNNVDVPAQTVLYTDSGYSPTELRIKKGETVIFSNQSSAGMWTASAMHPTHTVYPGSNIEKCGTGEIIFDACRNYESGEAWSFTFDEVGTWSYHNHSTPSHFGRIIVEE